MHPLDNNCDAKPRGRSISPTQSSQSKDFAGVGNRTGRKNRRATVFPSPQRSSLAQTHKPRANAPDPPDIERQNNTGRQQ
jgi:hypothetical protein